MLQPPSTSAHRAARHGLLRKKKPEPSDGAAGRFPGARRGQSHPKSRTARHRLCISMFCTETTSPQLVKKSPTRGALVSSAAESRRLAVCHRLIVWVVKSRLNARTLSGLRRPRSIGFLSAPASQVCDRARFSNQREPAPEDQFRYTLGISPVG